MLLGQIQSILWKENFNMAEVYCSFAAKLEHRREHGLVDLHCNSLSLKEVYLLNEFKSRLRRFFD